MSQYRELNVACDDCKGGWPIDLSSLKEPIPAQIISCLDCGKQFSVTQGVLNHYFVDHIFISYRIRSSWIEHGDTEVQLGQLKRVTFTSPPSRIFDVFLTPTFNATVAAYQVSTQGFFIVSSKGFGESEKTSGKINWLAFGDAKRSTTSHWKQLIADSKGYEIQKDPNMQIVTSAMALELFIDEFLRKNLKLKEDTLNRVLKNRVDEKISIWYSEVSGINLKNQFNSEHKAWKQKTKEMRDKIVHRGYHANIEEGKDAFKAVLKLISKIDADWFLK